MARFSGFDPLLGDIKIFQALRKQPFTGDGVTTDFTVTEFNLDDDYEVEVDGTGLVSGFSRAGNVVTISPAPYDGAVVIIKN